MLDTQEGSFSVQHPEGSSGWDFAQPLCVIELSSSISPAPGQGVIHKFCLWRSRRFVRRA